MASARFFSSTPRVNPTLALAPCKTIDIRALKNDIAKTLLKTKDTSKSATGKMHKTPLARKGASIQQGICGSPVNGSNGFSRNPNALDSTKREKDYISIRKSSTVKSTPKRVREATGKLKLKCRMGEAKSIKSLGLKFGNKHVMSEHRVDTKRKGLPLHLGQLLSEKRRSVEKLTEEKWQYVHPKELPLRNSKMQCLIDQIGSISQETSSLGFATLIGQRKNSMKEITSRKIVYPLKFRRGQKTEKEQKSIKQINSKITNTLKLLEVIKNHVLDIQLDFQAMPKESLKKTPKEGVFTEELTKLKNRIARLVQSKDSV